MRLLWHSNAPWSNTGYGTQTRLFAPRVRDLGHEVAISAYWGLNGAVIAWDGMTVYPGDEAWGNRLLPALAEHYDADLTLTLMDVWVLTNSRRLAEIPLASWVPVDHDPAPAKVVDFFERTGARPLAMSRFGERMLRDAGLDPLYVPHGVDTRVFSPQQDRERVRAQMGMPADAFVVGTVAANKGNSPSRKAFPQLFQAFAKLREERSDAYLYLHCDATGAGVNQGLNLGKLAEACGIPDDAIRFTAPLQLELGVPDEYVAGLYSAFDVLANASYGEGFGIPIIEAQACGTKVITTDWTAMSELCGPGSWLVDGEPYFNAGMGSFWKAPSITGLLAALREAYEQRSTEPALEARRFALDYDADVVTKRHWRPALAALAPRPSSELLIPAGVRA